MVKISKEKMMIQKTSILTLFIFFTWIAASISKAEETCDREKIKNIIQKCENGEGKSCLELSEMKSNCPKKSSYTIQELIQGCEQKKAEYCQELGFLYATSHSRPVEKDFAKAFQYYQKACALNFAKGCFSMGW